MATNTRTWAEAVGLTQARAGASFAPGTELDNIGFLLNSAARTIYDESRWWERFLIVEEREVVDGYIPYTEYAYNVSGAGDSGVDGDYKQDGTAGGRPSYKKGTFEEGYNYITYDDSEGGLQWVITNKQGFPAYLAAVDTSTPPLDGWVIVDGQGIEPAPTLEEAPTIGEYIGHWDGELWTCADAQRGQAYPDHNGIKIANCNHGDTVWVAYKKEFTDTYGDGENGTVSDIPAEWIEFMSYDAARAYAASQGNQDGYNPVAIRDVDRALERALMKVSRQGINETIALYFRTNYGYDVSVK